MMNWATYEVTMVRSNDWEGLYIDNKLAMQGHGLDVSSCLKLLSERIVVEATIDFEERWIKEEVVEELGDLPVDFELIKEFLNGED